ncbi:PaaI family thioesterase [Peptococcaceae bacterium 1198_IL3148]
MFEKIDHPENPCFGCSPHNPIGLKLLPQVDEDKCVAVFTPRPEHQGWVGYMHGGLITTLLDEVMGNWLWQNDKPSVTAEMNVRFIKPVPIGDELTAIAHVKNERSRIVEMEAEILLADGQRAAKATAKFFKKERGFTGE